MIPFEEIDNRLKGIGKTRAWLAEASGKKPDTIRGALAPGAAEFKRSAGLQKALTIAIEGEEMRQAASRDDRQESAPEIPPGFTAIYLQGEELDRADEASRLGPWKTLGDFCREAIRVRADELIAEKKGEPSESLKFPTKSPAPSRPSRKAAGE